MLGMIRNPDEECPEGAGRVLLRAFTVTWLGAPVEGIISFFRVLFKPTKPSETSRISPIVSTATVASVARSISV